MPGKRTALPLRPLILLLALLLAATAGAAVVSAQGGDITRGSELYDANCAVCHGTDGQGRLGINLSNDFPAIDPDAFVRDVIARGVNNTAMPPWSDQYGGPLTEAQIDDLVAFVASLSGGRSPMAPTATPLPVTPVPTVPGASGDPTLGRVLFLENCAMCHGDQGQGLRGSNLNKAFASFDPQQFVRATVARGIANTAMPAWSTANGGPLSEAQIDDISAYILTLAPRPEASPQATPVQQSPAEESGGIGTALTVFLALVVVAILIILVIQLSSRGGRKASS